MIAAIQTVRPGIGARSLNLLSSDRVPHPLDGTRRWYRYHHLFADVLQAHLLAERPEQVSELHRRAAEWHETAGDRMEAIHHALAGRDFGRAAGNVVDPRLQVITSAGAGSAAAIAINADLVREDVERAVAGPG